MNNHDPLWYLGLTYTIFAVLAFSFIVLRSAWAHLASRNLWPKVEPPLPARRRIEKVLDDATLLLGNREELSGEMCQDLRHEIQAVRAELAQ